MQLYASLLASLALFSSVFAAPTPTVITDAVAPRADASDKLVFCHFMVCLSLFFSFWLLSYSTLY